MSGSPYVRASASIFFRTQKNYDHFFVDFDGKKDIKFRDDNFKFDSADNDWPRVFKNFSSQI